MAERVSEVLLAEKSVLAYILSQDQNITKFFASKYSMDPLTIKHNRIIKPHKTN